MVVGRSIFTRNLAFILFTLFLLAEAVFGYFIWTVEGQNLALWQMVANLLIISIPLGLIFGAVFTLLAARHERSALGQVGPGLRRIVYWAPRVASILIILFISLFSLDVFEQNASPLELLVGFLMHNIPSIALIVLLVFAWKRPAVGFAAFLAAAFLFVAFFVRSLQSLPNLLVFVLPLLLIAFLFYADWRWIQPPPPGQAAETAQQ